MSDFLKNAFLDMKESAQLQHEVDKANFQAIKTESKANFAEIKKANNLKTKKESNRSRLTKELSKFQERIALAENRIDNCK